MYITMKLIWMLLGSFACSNQNYFTLDLQESGGLK